ncbi:MAG: hypothetical protein AAF502_15335 [Bacteroidota bacterium]
MKFQLFGASVLQVVFRFYLMMATVILFGIIGNVYLMALGMAIFVTAVLAIKVEFPALIDSKIVKLKKSKKEFSKAG